jgi:hypothetical protein
VKLNNPTVKLWRNASGSFNGELTAYRTNRKGEDVKVVLDFEGLWASELRCIARSAIQALVQQRDALDETLDQIRQTVT